MSIDLATGVMSLESTDVGLFGAVPVELKRQYSVNDRDRRGVLGPGWRWNFDYRLRQTLEGFSLVTDRGTEIQFLQPAGETQARLFDTVRQLELRQLSADELVLIGYGVDRLPCELVFSRIGKLEFRFSAVRNSCGFRVDLSYDSAGRLITVQQQREHREIRLAYDQRGQLATATVSSGSVPAVVHFRYAYDDLGRLVNVADHEGTTNQYVYDDAGRITSELRRSGAIYQFAFDASNRCIHVRGSDGSNERRLKYDLVKRVTEQRDSHGELSLFEYNERGQITKVVTPTGAIGSTQYDADGRVLGEVSADKFARFYAYDALGRRVEIAYPGGRTGHFEYDDQHYAVATEDSRGLRTAMERDPRGLVTALVWPDGRRLEREYDSNGDLVLQRDAAGAETRFGYDAHGRPVTRHNALGMTWHYGYDELGLLVRKQDPTGMLTEFGYDAQQRLAWMRAPDGSTTRYVSEPNAFYEHRGDGATRYIRYSSCGQAVEVSDFAGNVSRFEWDTEQSRMLAFQTPGGGRHLFAYNADGELVEHLSPAGRARRFEWKDRRLTATIDPAGRRVEREYDALGFLTKLKSKDGDIVYQFDPKHCALSKLTSPDAEFEHERDAFGIVCATRADGIEVRQSFEKRDRLAELSTSLGDKINFDYDPRGQLAQADFGFCSQRFSYDAMNHEVARELLGAGSLSMQYDAVGHLLQLAFRPAGAMALAVGAEPMAPLTGYTRAYDWAPGDRLTRQVDSLRGWRRFVHGPTLRLMAVDESSGQTQFLDYDGDGNRHFRADVSDNHQLLMLPFQPAQPVRWSDVPAEALRRGGNDTRYGYDADGRLLEVRSVTHGLQYEYDAAGYVTAKHLLLAGRRDTWRFRWNAFGYLVAVLNPKGETWTYRYDGVGRRVAKVDPQGEVTRYVWHNANIIYELKGSETNFYAYHPLTDELLAVRGKETGHVVCDHIGAPAEVIGVDGQIKGLLNRDSWGRRTDAVPLPHVFPGQYQDLETGLSYNFLRYYDPDIGRYLSPDPLGLRGGLNAYGYVASPEQLIDPQGEIARRPTTIANASPQPGRTQVNNPERGHPYMGGHDMVNGQRVDLGGATVTDVHDGNQGVVAHAYNGAPPGDLEGPRSANVDSGASTSSWWHSEQNAMTAVLRGAGSPPGPPPHITLQGEGPITFEISREPCCRCRDALLGESGLAQAVADATGRPVKLKYPTEEDPQMAERETIEPSPKDCG